MGIPEVSVKSIGLEEASPLPEDYKALADDLFAAFEQIGFVYVKDHGIPETTIRDAMEQSRKFFDLPLQDKKKILRDPVNVQGYVESGMEIFNPTVAPQEIREAFSVSRIEGESAMFPDDLVPGMRKALTELALASRELSLRLLRAFAISFGVDPDVFLGLYQKFFTSGSMTKLRTLNYPAIQGPKISGVIRCGEHSDYGLMTLLYQDNMGGLEVLNINNEWVPANPIKGAILINAGDMMEMFTNGRLPATLHRVVVPEEETRRNCPRQSMAFFVHPDRETMVAPLPAFDEKYKGKNFEPMLASEHVKKRYAETYQY